MKTLTLVRMLMIKYLGGSQRRVDYFRNRGMKIGTGCDIQDPFYSFDGIDHELVAIGDHVTVTSTARLITHDGSCRVILGRARRLSPSVIGKITIGDNVFIGVNSIIMPGVTIGSNTIVGAGAVVTKSLAPGCIAAGSPARSVSTLDQYRRRLKSLDTMRSNFTASYKPPMEAGKRYLEFFEDMDSSSVFFENLDRD